VKSRGKEQKQTNKNRRWKEERYKASKKPGKKTTQRKERNTCRHGSKEWRLKNSKWKEKEVTER
jgi:hypothetical protein